MYCMARYVLYGKICIVWQDMYCMARYVLYGKICIVWQDMYCMAIGWHNTSRNSICDAPDQMLCCDSNSLPMSYKFYDI